MRFVLVCLCRECLQSITDITVLGKKVCVMLRLYSVAHCCARLLPGFLDALRAAMQACQDEISDSSYPEC